MPSDAFLAKIKDFIDHWDYLQESQNSWHARLFQWRRRWDQDPSLYLRSPPAQAGDIPSSRPRLKDWQHVICSPRGFVNEQAAVMAMSNLIAEASPVFRTRGWQYDDIPTETPQESIVNYEYAILNPVTEWLREGFERARIQGVAPMKQAYVNEGFDVNLLPRQWAVQRFQDQVKAARDVIEQERMRGDKSAQDVPGIQPDGSVRVTEADLPAFMQWSAGITQRYPQIKVPEPPVAKTRRVYRHVGLKIDHIDKPDILWDPRIPTFREQKRMFQRRVFDKIELMNQCRAANERAVRENRREPFDLVAIEGLQVGVFTAGGQDYSGVGEYQQAAYRWMGVDNEPIRDPAMKNAVEVIEVWEPADAIGRSYWCWIGQRQTPLTNEGVYPIGIPVHPYSGFINIPTPGMLIGRSDYDVNSAQYDILDTLSGYQMDYVALAIGQPVVHTGGLGITGRKLEPRPFEMIEGEEGEAFTQVFDFRNPLTMIGEYRQMLERELDQGVASGGAARGEDASLNRVGVGEVQLRAQNQANRPRDMMHRCATTLSRDMIPLGMYLVYQFGSPEHIQNVSGVGDPFEMMDPETLWPVMQQNHMSMPAALLTESALALQQIQDLMEMGTKMGVLIPMKKAAMAVWMRVAQLQRVQGLEQIGKLMQSDVAEATQQQAAAAQLAQAQQQLKDVQKEADALRKKIGIPSAAELNAEMEAIKAMGEQPQLPGGQQPAQLPPGEEGGEPPPEGAAPTPPQGRVM
jgi:hypothetical protein